MDAVDVARNIISTNLLNANLRYCLVDDNKLPHKMDGTLAKPNCMYDFVDFDTISSCDSLDHYHSLGISVQASNICGVDIDHVVAVPFDFSSVNQLGKDIVGIFKDWAYVEFSFSGTGLRILYRQKLIEDYRMKYYIKNSKIGVEYYQPAIGKDLSNRYLTITGRSVYDNSVDCAVDHSKDILAFVNKYRKRSTELVEHACIEETDNRTLEQLIKNVKAEMLSNGQLLDVWYTPAPGSGKDESERDFRLLTILYNTITKDKTKLKELFEQSPFFKTKDDKHMRKWTLRDYRYYNYLYSVISKY